jgi:hypothetical protein
MLNAHAQGIFEFHRKISVTGVLLTSNNMREREKN